jgi:hypothetical protein
MQEHCAPQEQRHTSTVAARTETNVPTTRALPVGSLRSLPWRLSLSGEQRTLSGRSFCTGPPSNYATPALKVPAPPPYHD